jgi:hypothetical protein
MTVLAAIFAAMFFFVSEASATKMTEQQVKTTCGSTIQSGCTKTACAQGCEKKCGEKLCTYNCCQGKGCGEQGCHGHVVGRTVFGGKVKLPISALIRERQSVGVIP